MVNNDDLSLALGGWSKHLADDDFRTAAEVMDAARMEIDRLRRLLAIAEHHVYFCDKFHPDGTAETCPTCGEDTLERSSVSSPR